jgi:hypothetical protein
MTFSAVLLHIRTTASRDGKSAALACIDTIRMCRRLPGEPRLTAEEGAALTRLEGELKR